MAELGSDVKVVATGGLASLMGGGSKYIREVDDLLTLEGLRIIYERNLLNPRKRGDQGQNSTTSAEPPTAAVATPKRG